MLFTCAKERSAAHSDMIHEFLHSTDYAAMLLPMLSVHLWGQKEVWVKPALVQTFQGTATELFYHCAPCLMIVHLSSKSRHFKSLPDSNGWKVDILAREDYFLYYLLSKIQIYHAYNVVHVHHEIFLLSLCAEFSSQNQQLLNSVVDEVAHASCLHNAFAKQAVCCLSKPLTNYITLSRHAWLKSASFQPDILNEGEEPFSYFDWWQLNAHG